MVQKECDAKKKTVWLCRLLLRDNWEMKRATELLSKNAMFQNERIKALTQEITLFNDERGN